MAYLPSSAFSRIERVRLLEGLTDIFDGEREREGRGRGREEEGFLKRVDAGLPRSHDSEIPTFIHLAMLAISEDRTRFS